MKKPLLALGLAGAALSGALPVAGTLAAPPPRIHSASAHRAAHSADHPAPVSADAIIRTAKQYLGYPYLIDGTSPSTGFSCIGFVSFVYKSNGIPVPGDLDTALAYAPEVPLSRAQPGDVLFFANTVWPGLSHAAIYLGDGKFIHAEWYNRGVVISSFKHDPVDYDYWSTKYLTANRPLSVPVADPAVLMVAAHPWSGPTAVVTASSLNLRSGPSLGAGIQETLLQNARAAVLGRQGKWYRVRVSGGAIGWLSGQYVIVHAGTHRHKPLTPQAAKRRLGRIISRTTATIVHQWIMSGQFVRLWLRPAKQGRTTQTG